MAKGHGQQLADGLEKEHSNCLGSEMLSYFRILIPVI